MRLRADLSDEKTSKDDKTQDASQVVFYRSFESMVFVSRRKSLEDFCIIGKGWVTWYSVQYYAECSIFYVHTCMEQVRQKIFPRNEKMMVFEVMRQRSIRSRIKQIV